VLVGAEKVPSARRKLVVPPPDAGTYPGAPEPKVGGTAKVESALRKEVTPPPDAGTQPTRLEEKMFDPQMVRKGTSLSRVPLVLFQTAISLTVDDPGPATVPLAENAEGGAGLPVRLPQRVFGANTPVH